MHSPTSVLENVTHNLLRVFDILSLGETSRPNNQQPKKRTCKFVEFAVLTNYRVKLIERKKKDKYLDLELNHLGPDL